MARRSVTTQLNATVPAEVVGTFTYLPPSGTVLGAGTHTLSVTFTPTNTADYNDGHGVRRHHGVKATPVITWPTPAAITLRHGAQRRRS